MRLLFVLWCFLPLTLIGQALQPVTWSFSKEKVNEEEFDLIFTAEIDKGWNVYSQFIDEGGPFPTTITYETDGVEKVGESAEDGYRKEGMDRIFEMNVIKFLSGKPYIIKQRVKKAGLDQISGYLTYMCCDDEKCLPPTDVEFTFDLTATSSSNSGNTSLTLL